MFTDVKIMSVVICSVLVCNCGGAPGGILPNSPVEQSLPIWNASTIHDDSVVDVAYIVIDDNSILYELDYAGDALDRGADCYDLLKFEVQQSNGLHIASSPLSTSSYVFYDQLNSYTVLRLDSNTENSNSLVELPLSTDIVFSERSYCA